MPERLDVILTPFAGGFIHTLLPWSTVLLFPDRIANPLGMHWIGERRRAIVRALPGRNAT